MEPQGTMTRTYAVIGDPIDHSLSPSIHGAAFRDLGMDCSYISYRVPAGELEDGVEALKKIGISGFNVTIPHKIDMVKLLDSLDETCSLTGAANTVSVEDGRLRGYNTDMDGFLDPLDRRGIDPEGMSVLLAGAGGAARAIVAGLAKRKASSVTISNRSRERAGELCRFAERLGLDAKVGGPGAAGYDMAVNSTSLGMAGESSPVSFEGAKGIIAYDIVYRPVKTDFIARAKGAGASIVYGYEMLLGQAARSFRIWHGRDAPYDSMKRVLLGGV